MHYTITQKSLEQLKQEGNNVTSLRINNGKRLLPLRFRAYGRSYREAFENMTGGYESIVQDFREGLPEEKDITLGICEQESKLSKDDRNNDVVIIIGRIMALIS